MTLYAVISPAFDYVEPVPGCYGQGPTYQASCYVEVEASTKRQARVLACRTPEFSDYVWERRGDGMCPFTGLKVIDVLEEWGPEDDE